MEQGKKIGLLAKHKHQKFFILGLVLFFSVCLYHRILNAASNTPVQPSQIVNGQLERIYNSSESVQIAPAALGQTGASIEPWKDAKVMMKANRDSMLDLQINAMNYALYLQDLGTSTPEDQVLTTHFSRFCSRNSANEASGSTFNCQNDAALQYADIMPSGLEGFRIEPEQEEGLLGWVRNVVNPSPSSALSDRKVLSPDSLKDPKNRKLIAQALAEQAALSTARQALISSVVRRRPIEDLSGKSFMEIVEKEAVKDFLNDGWQQQMDKNYQAAIKAGKQDLAMSIDNGRRGAFTNFILYQIYRELEQNKILLAVQVSILEQQAKAGAGVLATTTSGGGQTAGGAK